MVLSPKKPKTTSNSDHRPTWSEIASNNVTSVKMNERTLLESISPITDSESGKSQYAIQEINLDNFFSLTKEIIPWIEGLEGGSTLIDITDIKDAAQLKGFSSLPLEAQIARVKVDGLSLLHPAVLREQMEERFSSFGKVLDIGFVKDREWLCGRGYVVLNLNLSEYRGEPYEKSSGAIGRLGGTREVLLTCDEMPSYCRFCQKDDHCRADCQDRLRYLSCFNCNGKGHAIPDCPCCNHYSPMSTNKRVPIQPTVTGNVPTKEPQNRAQNQKSRPSLNPPQKESDLASMDINSNGYTQKSQTQELAIEPVTTHIQKKAKVQIDPKEKPVKEATIPISRIDNSSSTQLLPLSNKQNTSPSNSLESAIYSPDSFLPHNLK
ncbi:hypothetical protein BY458DRAFT_582713 [Sporodiniella umbellata]|nr:hypothetical protein BY458DRAFT_582713 [Sporodiniella umbellata]